MASIMTEITITSPKGTYKLTAEELACLVRERVLTTIKNEYDDVDKTMLNSSLHSIGVVCTNAIIDCLPELLSSLTEGLTDEGV